MKITKKTTYLLFFGVIILHLRGYLILSTPLTFWNWLADMAGMSLRYQHLAETIALVDINQSNIDFCKERFSSFSKIDYLVNNGSDLSMIPDQTKTAIFSYDAMVHFELLDVINYIQEFCRVLQPGGRALLHHSNNSGNPGGDPMWHPTWRNFMSLDIMAHVSSRFGFTIIEQQPIFWGGFNNIDGITLIQKI
jgi:ubiquinone/menaquinone biosynthesis C-methylase UbiE